MVKNKDIIEEQRRNAVFDFSFLLQYIKMVEKEIGMEKALEILGQISAENRVNWFDWYKSTTKRISPDAIGANKVLRDFMKMVTPGWDPKTFKIIVEKPNKVIFRYTGFCTWLEACKNVALQTSKVCPYVSEHASNAMFKKINPKLKIKINKFRPIDSYCEEEIRID
jgi:hypothetical protein